jgi:hypothetical protein
MKGSTCVRPVDLSPRTSSLNPEWVESLRRKLQAAAPRGSWDRVHKRTAIPIDTISNQVRGEKVHLWLEAFGEGLMECLETARREIVDEFLEPLGLVAVPRPAAVSELLPLLAANAELLRSIGHIEAALSAALADGKVDQDEAREVARTVVEARTRLQALETVVFGGRA